MSDAGTMLEQAEAAYRDIIQGDKIRDLTDQNGERVTYARPNLPELLAYINRLKFEASSGNRGPMRPVF